MTHGTHGFWFTGAPTIPAHGFTQAAVQVLQAVDLHNSQGPWWWLVEHGETWVNPFLGSWKLLWQLDIDFCCSLISWFLSGLPMLNRHLLRYQMQTAVRVGCETFWTVCNTQSPFLAILVLVWGFWSVPRKRSWSSCPTIHNHDIRFTSILNGITPTTKLGLLTIYLHLLQSTLSSHSIISSKFKSLAPWLMVNTAFSAIVFLPALSIVNHICCEASELAICLSIAYDFCHVLLLLIPGI